MSGSYMLYGSHGAAPDESVFAQVKLDVPNYSGRMDNMRAALLRRQIETLPDKVRRWNLLYQTLETGLRASPHIEVPQRAQHEDYVGSSIQFKPMFARDGFDDLIAACGKRGVDIKWFGADAPKAFTSRYDSWRYLGEQPQLPRTLEVLSRTCDMRVPLTFSETDCREIVQIIVGEVAAVALTHPSEIKAKQT